MKKQKKKLKIKVRDREPLKDVTGGRRHRAHGLQGEGFAQREGRVAGDYGVHMVQ
jgi:hypothetical protein